MTPRASSPALWGYIATVLAAAVASVAFQPRGVPLSTAWLLLLLGASVAGGLWPVRIASLRSQFTATDPLLLCSLALAGPDTATLVGLAAVAGAAFRRPPALRRLVFNVSAVTLSIGLTWLTFRLTGGVSGAPLRTVLLPLLAATATYFLCNSWLVTLAVSLEQRRNPLTVWTRSHGWTASTYFTSFSMGVVLLALLATLGPWSLLVGLPPCWMIWAFNRSHRERLDAQRRRIEEVEALNAELEATVAELKSAHAHVEQLQGLLPLCMHCKSVRDDEDAWQRIETYLAQHTDLRVTHSLCGSCAREHYPGMIDDVVAGK